MAEDVTFAVLGSVDVRVGDAELRLKGGRQRAMLAMLVLNRGRVVPVEALIDGLWGAHPPTSVRTQVHALVHGLRQSLGPAGAVVLTQPPGYRIRMDTRQLDLAVFEDRVAGARRAAAAGRLAEAADLYRAALDLWRGPALGGLSAPFAAAAAARLDEQRLAAVEEGMQVGLDAGRHDQLVPELIALVAENPLRERLRWQLMLALYRSGRQAEALEAYREGRDLLVTDFGLEPGPGLNRLQQAILACDQTLNLPGAASGQVPSGAAAAVPVATAHAGRPDAVRAAVPHRTRPAGRSGSRPRARHFAAAAVLFAATASGSVPTALPAARQPVAAQQIFGPTWVQYPQPVPSDLFGVTINSSTGRMPSFRVGAVRLWDSGTRWSELEPRRGSYDWRTLDRLVDGAERARLPVLFTFGGTPGWASPNGPIGPYSDGARAAPPDDLADWAAFVRAVAARYRGRIAAYELWVLAPSPRFYTGTAARLSEMTREASHILRQSDPRATIVCPSIGELWQPASRQFLTAFAAAGGYQYCDVGGVKLHQRNPGDKPETMIELTTLVDRTFHDAGVHPRIWNTGTTYRIATAARLSEYDADNYVIRFYLVGLYARYERMYFYNWGGTKIPIVLQAAGGPPTTAAIFVDRLEHWLVGARISSCGHGAPDGLPDNVWQCQFLLPDTGGSGHTDAAVIRWTDSGTAAIPAEAGAYQIQYLDRGTEPVTPGTTITITERPVLIRYMTNY